jgi:hypothetical protein
VIRTGVGVGAVSRTGVSDRGTIGVGVDGRRIGDGLGISTRGVGVGAIRAGVGVGGVNRTGVSVRGTIGVGVGGRRTGDGLGSSTRGVGVGAVSRTGVSVRGSSRTGSGLRTGFGVSALGATVAAAAGMGLAGGRAATGTGDRTGLGAFAMTGAGGTAIVGAGGTGLRSVTRGLAKVLGGSGTAAPPVGALGTETNLTGAAGVAGDAATGVLSGTVSLGPAVTFRAVGGTGTSLPGPVSVLLGAVTSPIVAFAGATGRSPEAIVEGLTRFAGTGLAGTDTGRTAGASATTTGLPDSAARVFASETASGLAMTSESVLRPIAAPDLRTIISPGRAVAPALNRDLPTMAIPPTPTTVSPGRVRMTLSAWLMTTLPARLMFTVRALPM